MAGQESKPVSGKDMDDQTAGRPQTRLFTECVPGADDSYGKLEFRSE
jgi:hypothetical protein